MGRGGHAALLLFLLVCARSSLAQTFGLGFRYETDRVSDGAAQWDFDGAVLEARVTPRFFVGRAKFDSRFRVAVGRGDAELRVALGSDEPTLYSGGGTLLGGGGEVRITSRQRSRALVIGHYGISTIVDSERFETSGFVSELERYRAYDAGVRFGYGFADHRIVPSAGMRCTHTDARVQPRGLVGLPALEVHDDRCHPIAGVDFNLTSHLTGGAEIGRDWAAVNVMWGFNSDSHLGLAQVCGRDLPPCNAAQFCNYPATAPCGQDGATATCAHRPPCDGPEVAVCGCDGKTYRNTQCAQNAGVSVAKAGACPDPCNAPSPEIVNGDFENGTYAGWETDYGSFKGEGAADWFGTEVDWDETEPNHPEPAVVTAATPLMKYQGTAVAPYCGASMLRINDLGGGSHATRVWQMFTRPAGSGACGALKIHWGTMLQDPGHAEKKQPHFEIEVVAGKKQLYHFRADATNAAEKGWTDIRATGELYPVWYRHALAIIPLHETSEGDTLEVRMSVADCREGNHGGAAFIDCVEIIDRCANPCPFEGKEPFNNAQLVVPNVFTPNGDFINDVWEILGVPGACTASATIHDRWGKIAATPTWHNTSGAPNGRAPLWDGRRDDGALALPSANPYYYVLRLTNCHGVKEIPGFLYVFRETPKERGDLLHVTAPTNAGRLWHTIRYDAEQTWQEFRDVENMADERGEFTDVDTAIVKRQLHVVGVTEDGKIWHSIRDGEAGGWQSFASVNEVTLAANKKFLRVSAADVNGELHVCAIDSDRKLWHTIRRAADWQFFADVLGATGPPLDGDGDHQFVDVGCTSVKGELHVVVVNQSGNLFHTIRHASAWQLLGNVRKSAPPPALSGKITSVGAGELNGALHVCVTTDAFGMYHTIRENGWQFFADVTSKTGVPDNGQFVDVSCRQSRGELHLVGVTKSGDLLHTIRHTVGWDRFGSIEDAAAGHRGHFRAVGIVGARVE